MPGQFSPTIMFAGKGASDLLAEKLMYGLYNDVHSTMDTERSRQTRIGISEIGNPCDKCVCRKLSEDQVKDPNWKAQVGTFIHAGLEEHFGAKYGQQGLRNTQGPDGRPEYVPADERPVYHLEQRVTPYRHRSGFTLDGSCDLYVEGATYGVVGDWKTQNSKKLATKTSKGDIGPTYTVQMQTYGLGWELRNKLVTHVALLALPRDGELTDAKFVLMRYDREVAIKALARIDGFLNAHELLEQVYPGRGWDMLIEQQTTASGCLDCPRYTRRDSRDFFSAMFAE